LNLESHSNNIFQRTVSSLVAQMKSSLLSLGSFISTIPFVVESFSRRSVADPVVIIILHCLPDSSFSSVKPILVFVENPWPKSLREIICPDLRIGTPSSIVGSLSACSIRNPTICRLSSEVDRLLISCDLELCVHFRV
jgi:hypothetical protein